MLVILVVVSPKETKRRKINTKCSLLQENPNKLFIFLYFANYTLQFYTLFICVCRKNVVILHRQLKTTAFYA